MREQHINFYSHVLQRDIPMLKFGDRGYPIVIFPTTLGSYYECKDFHLINSVKWFVEQGMVQIYCVDSINKESWYNKNTHPLQRVANHNFYDRFLHEEFIPQLREISGTGKVAVGGPSFGGFMAANYAFRHPEAVSHLFSMSGSFDIKSFVDGHYNEDVYFNNPMDFMPSNDNPELYNMKIILGTSHKDICLDSNLQMSGILNSKGINHWLDIRGHEPHDWPLWRDMFPHYLSLMNN